MLSYFLHTIVGLLAGYLTVTVSESALHRFIGHATSRRRHRWAANPRLCRYLLLSHFRHAVVHHGLTYKSNYVTQFDGKDHKDAVDRRTLAVGDVHVEKAGYGLMPGWTGLVTYNLTTVPVIVLLALVFEPVAAVAAIPWLAVAFALSRWFHPYLHRDHEAAVREAPRWVGRLLRTSYFRAVARHHFLHHKYPNSNFNLLLGGDWLLGVHRRATRADLDEMSAIGLRID